MENMTAKSVLFACKVFLCEGKWLEFDFSVTAWVLAFQSLFNQVSLFQPTQFQSCFFFSHILFQTIPQFGHGAAMDMQKDRYCRPHHLCGLDKLAV